MLHKILVALDDSEMRRPVFEAALTLAQKLDAQLLLLHVLSQDDIDTLIPALYPYSPTLSPEVLKRYDDQRQALYDQGIAILKALEAEARATGVMTEFSQNVGSPGSVICTIAKDYQADAIVMGRRGRAGLSEWVLGSVSNYVLHHACCSVFVVQGQSQSESKLSASQVAITI
jgi:nucleotide-binding universal stress UspA family protein